MELIAHEQLKRMSAMISGAIAFFEIEGDEILRTLRQQQKDDLVSGSETIGAALYWLRRQMAVTIKEADANEKA